jgi:DNA-binding NarL/FixJ family response regulator
MAMPDAARARKYVVSLAIRLLTRWPGWIRETATSVAEACRDAPALTAREEEVLALVAEGRSNRQIARKLGAAERTIAVHVSRILAETGTASRTEAAVRHLAEKASPKHS